MLINRSLLSCNLLIVSFKHPPDKIWKIHFIGGGGCVQGSSTTYKKNSRRIYCQTFWRFPGPTFLKTSVQESPRFMSSMTSLHPLTLFSPWKHTFCIGTSNSLPSQRKITSDQHVWTSPWTFTDVSSSLSSSQPVLIFMVILHTELDIQRAKGHFISYLWQMWTLSPSAVHFLICRRQHGFNNNTTHNSFSLIWL